VPIIAMLLVVWVLTETPRLLSLAGGIIRPLRDDPGVLWACGVIGGGYVTMWLLAHPGYSQHYFWTVTLGLSTVLTVTNATRVLPASRRASTLIPPMIVAAIPGVVAAWATTTLAPVDLGAPARSVIEDRLRPYALVLAALAVAVLATVLLRICAPQWSLPMLTAVTIFCLAACLPAPLLQLQHTRPPRMDPLPKVGVSYQYVSPEQQRAALWLQRHSGSTSVVATNMYCWPMGKDRPGCTINSMWLSGLSGRRMVLGDWSYASATMSRYGASTLLNRTPAPWPERRRLSTQAVKSPTSQVLGQLRRAYGARWIFADSRASKIARRLQTLATLRYESTHIRIYRLHDGYPR
jgi:hypothetical protein